MRLGLLEQLLQRQVQHLVLTATPLIKLIIEPQNLFLTGQEFAGKYHVNMVYDDPIQNVETHPNIFDTTNGASLTLKQISL